MGFIRFLLLAILVFLVLRYLYRFIASFLEAWRGGTPHVHPPSQESSPPTEQFHDIRDAKFKDLPDTGGESPKSENDDRS